MKKIFLILLFAAPILFAQRSDQRQDSQEQYRIPFSVEVHTIPDDSLNTIYFSYRLPYNQLTFVKDGDQYKAALGVAIEVFDTSGQFVSRQMKQHNIEVNDFSETNSPEYFCQDILAFHLPNKDYNFIHVITDVQSGQEAKIKSEEVQKVKSDLTEFLEPLVINENKFTKDGENLYILTNYEDAIPFSSKKYQLVIPCKNTSAQKIYVEIINNSDTVFSGYTNESFLSGISLKENDGNILIEPGKNDVIYRDFILNNFSNALSEGEVQIIVKNSENSTNPEKFIKYVNWFNKPFSLRNPQFAITSLKYMEKDSVISRLLDADKVDYMPELMKYWKRYDPTPDTRYNELMNVYYERVDYAIRNFASLSNRNGADTDRGKIYIKFGKPAKIERSSDDNGKIVELWIYTKEKLSFKFVDKNGTGEFPLAKG